MASVTFVRILSELGPSGILPQMTEGLRVDFSARPFLARFSYPDGHLSGATDRRAESMLHAPPPGAAKNRKTKQYKTASSP